MRPPCRPASRRCGRAASRFPARAAGSSGRPAGRSRSGRTCPSAVRAVSAKRTRCQPRQATSPGIREARLPDRSAASRRSRRRRQSRRGPTCRSASPECRGCRRNARALPRDVTAALSPTAKRCSAPESPLRRTRSTPIAPRPVADQATPHSDADPLHLVEGIGPTSAGSTDTCATTPRRRRLHLLVLAPDCRFGVTLENGDVAAGRGEQGGGRARHLRRRAPRCSRSEPAVAVGRD